MKRLHPAMITHNTRLGVLQAEGAATTSKSLSMANCFDRRLLLSGLSLLLVMAATSSLSAQWVNRNVARWSVGNAVYGGSWYSPVQYGATGYSNYPYNGYNTGGQTAYGNAVRAQAELTMAQGKASRDAAVAAEHNEKARAQYIENQARYNQLRQQQREVIEARKAKETAERREKGAARPQKKPTDLYSKLSAYQLDRTTGKVEWPECLNGKQFEEDRAMIESILSSVAQNGPDERSAGIIRETANHMKAGTNDILSDISFEAYTDARKFLGSLSVEGYYALEEL